MNLLASETATVARVWTGRKRGTSNSRLTGSATRFARGMGRRGVEDINDTVSSLPTNDKLVVRVLKSYDRYRDTCSQHDTAHNGKQWPPARSDAQTAENFRWAQDAGNHSPSRATAVQFRPSQSLEERSRTSPAPDLIMTGGLSSCGGI